MPGVLPNEAPVVLETQTRPAAALVSGVVPDVPEFRTEGFARAGNNAVLHSLREMIAAGLEFTGVFSIQPMPAFPRGKRLWMPRRTVELFPGCAAQLLPHLNLPLWKQIHLGFSAFFALLRWAWRNRGRPRVILQYNLTRPPALFIFLAARLTGSKYAAMLYDIGTPPVKIDHMFWYRVDDFCARRLVRRLDGRIVITRAILDDYAPGAHGLHVDGAVDEAVIPDWPLPAPRDEFVLCLAGSLWELNGVRLLLDAFGRLDDPALRLEIAGHGVLADLVREATQRDNRIRYHGLLAHDQVLELYRRSDVLLNIRLTQGVGKSYLFASKLLEYLAMGRTVITTAMAHAAEEYGPFAYVLRDETPEALADLIRQIRQTPFTERQARAEAGRRYMKLNKTWRRQGERMTAYLSAVARGCSAAAAQLAAEGPQQ